MNEDKRKRYTRRGAIGLMGVGAVGVVSETLGFTNLTAGRGVDIDVVTDDNENAILRIIDNDDGQPIAGKTFGDSVQIDIENNSGSELSAGDLVVTVDATDVTGEDLEVSSDDFTDGGTITKVSDPIELKLEAGISDSNTASFTLETTEDSGGDVTVNITFDATFNGTSLTATREDITVDDTT